MTPYRLLFEQVLTRVDAETAHRLGFAAIRLGARAGLSGRVGASAHGFAGADAPTRGGSGGADAPTRRGSGGADAPTRRGVRALGLDFPGVLGLAAGFDKNAVGVDALAALGFSFVEVGTVTAEPQPGNPRPRLFRLPADHAVVNRMGFNNDGAEVVAQRLARRSRRGRTRPVVVGVNIGRTKAVPEDDQAAVLADYEKSTRLLAPHADYLVVNVSSPNTPGLRALQAVDRLAPLLAAVRRRADAATDRRVPLLVKIAPDLSDDEVAAVADLVTATGLDGVVATNTTTSRAGLVSAADEVERVGAGGLSGAPLADRSLEVLRLLRRHLGSGPAVISVGGISTVDDARLRLAAGATLLQAYTAFVYEGPLWPSRVQRALRQQSLTEGAGTTVRP